MRMPMQRTSAPVRSLRRPVRSVRRPGRDPLVTIGLAAVLTFFLVSGASAYRNVTVLRDDNRQIVHSHDVIVALAELLSNAKDAETGQRGYLLTGNEKYLE